MNSHITALLTRRVIATAIAAACFGAMAVPCFAAASAPAVTASVAAQPATSTNPNGTPWG